MQARGEDIDLISNPSQAEIIQKQFREKKVILESAKKAAILEKYGSVTETLDPRLRLGQTEAYSEYSRDGRVIRGAGKTVVRTKYEEDVFINNHTSVWGSYFNRTRFAWGYACCHSLVRNSYCVGAAGIAINDAANNQAIDIHQERKMLERVPQANRSSASTLVMRSDIFGESSADATLDEAKLQEAIRRQEEAKRNQSTVESDDRKRSYNSMQPIDVRPEDMEAYRLTKMKRDDPMSNLLDPDAPLLEYK